MSSSIKHDASGFLIGDLLESSKEMLDAQQTGIGIWRGIRRDVSGIARALGTSARTGSPSVRATAEPSGRGTAVALSPRNIGAQVAAAVTRSRGSDGRFTTAAKPLSRSTIKTVAEETRRVTVASGNRDLRTGRFGVGAGGGDAPDREGGTGFLADKLGKVAEAFKGAATGAENIDPSITALSEVKSVLEPFGRGAFALLGRNPEKKKERWYNRFLKALTKRNEPTVLSGGEGAGGGGMLATLFRLFGPVVAAIGPALLAGLGLTAAGGLGVFIGSKIYEWLDKAGIATKIFDTFDAVKDWFKGKFEQVGKAVQDVKDEYSAGVNQGMGTAGSNNAHRKMEAGGAAPTPPASMAEAVGRVVGSAKRGAAYMAGQRKRASFEGIKGGDGLTANGSYTDDEAQRVRDLKNSGANTGAFGKGGMSQEIQAKISEKAIQHGLDPKMMQKIVAMESGGNPNAISSTGAIGLMQFTGKTATGVGIKDRFDVDQNLDGGMKLTNENAAALKKKGMAVTAENLYMMHQLGPKAAQEVISGAQKGLAKSDLSASTQKAMNLNYGAKSGTAKEYLASNTAALDSRLALTTATTTMPTLSTAPLPKIAAVSVPPSVPVRLPVSPEVAIPPPAGGDKTKTAVSPAREPIGQNMADRQIAHIVSGGIGSNGWG